MSTSYQHPTAGLVPSIPVTSGEPATHSQTLDHGDDPWARKIVLSLDGEGVSGHSALSFLKRLMSKVQQYEEEEEPNIESSAAPRSTYKWIHPPPSGRYCPSPFLPCHYFDYIGGTGTGGLIAIMLGRLRHDVDTALDVYQQLSREVFQKNAGGGHSLFDRGVKKRTIALEQIFYDIRPALQGVGESRSKFGYDESRCRTVVCVLKSEKLPPYLFRSYHHPAKSAQSSERDWDGGHDIPITLVAQASCGGTEYIVPMQWKGDSWFDTGAKLKDPSWEILKEVNQMHEDSYPAIDVFLSIGSDSLDPTRSGRESDEGGSKRLFFHIPRVLNKGHLGDMVDLVEKKVLEASEDLNYYRFNPDLESSDTKGGSESDEGTDVSVGAGLAFPKKTEEDLGNLARLLVKRRRARAQTNQWEWFALGTRYRCSVKDCEFPNAKDKNYYKDWDEFWKHLTMEHGLSPDEAVAKLHAGRINN
jgi:hypothetical protein